MSNSSGPHGLQHARPPCPSPTYTVYSNSCLLSWWCHPTISSSVVPFSSCLQSFLASGSLQMSQLFTSGGKVLEFQLQHQPFQWTHAGLISFRMDWLDLLQPKGLYLEFSPTAQFKSINSSVLSHVQIFVSPWTIAHGLAMASILEWVAISFSRGSFQPRDWTWVSCTAGRLFYHLSHQGSQNFLRWWLKALYSEHIP